MTLQRLKLIVVDHNLASQTNEFDSYRDLEDYALKQQDRGPVILEDPPSPSSEAELPKKLENNLQNEVAERKQEIEIQEAQKTPLKRDNSVKPKKKFLQNTLQEKVQAETQNATEKSKKSFWDRLK